MKRLIVVLCVVAFIVALPLSHSASAKQDRDRDRDKDCAPVKVEICHVNSANDILDLGILGVYALGKVIEVSENAVATHEAHGDSNTFSIVDQDQKDFIEDLFGIQIAKNVNCKFAL